MANKNGTLELIGKEISNALLPLEQRLQGSDLQNFFMELGLRFPEGFETTGSFVNDLNTTIDLISELPALISDLHTAVDAEDSIAIATVVADIGVVITDLITSLDNLKTSLESISGSIVGLSSTDVLEFATDLSKRIFEYTLIFYLEGYYPVFNSLLTFIGVVEYTGIQGDSLNEDKVSYLKRELLLHKIADLFSNPEQLMIDLYGWGDDPNFDGNKIINHVHNIVYALGLPVEYTEPDGVNPAKLAFRTGYLIPRDDITPKGLEFIFGRTLEGGFIYQTPNFIPNWHGEFDVDVSIGAQTSLILQPGGKITFIPPAGQVEGGLMFSIVGEPEGSNDSLMIFGKATGSHISADRIKAGVKLLFDWNSTENQANGSIGFEAAVEKGKIIITAGEGDSFLNKILSDDIEAEFDFILGWDGIKGFYFGGSAGIEVAIPVHKSLFGLELETLYLKMSFNNGIITPEISIDTNFELGPFAATISRLGVEAELKPENGNLGPLDASINFKPPTGIGFSIDASVFKGGGFLSFNFDEERYVGALELTIKDKISLKVIGILTTKLPSNDDGFSLLLLITAEFQPINLGFGFTLNGVGGLIAIHRTMNLNYLRDGVKSNTLDNILFPTDPIANINQIISDLEGAFPIEEGRFAFGPMAIIGWGTPTLITVELGLMIEVPSPVRIAVLGVLKAILPTEEKSLLKLQVNFLGTLDFEAKFITFDASIFASKLLSFTLEGDMAFRLKWGDNSNFLFSIGGFHPSYTPPPLQLPTMKRLTINLLGGNNPRLTLTAYFAVTSNTVQFGSAVDFYYKITNKYSVVGYLGFDILIQFNPFYLTAQIAASLALMKNGNALMSIYLGGSVSGPAPWHVKGKAEIEICGITLKANFDKTFGQPEVTTLPDVLVLPRLLEALSNRSNWQASTPAGSNLLVTLRELDSAPGNVVAHPFGTLGVSQKVVPLDITINKFGTQRPADYKKFELDIADSSGNIFEESALKEYFAPAEFLQMSDSAKLSRKSFEEFNSGVSIKGNNKLKSSYLMDRELMYEQIVMDSRNKPEKLPIMYAEKAVSFRSFIKNGTAAKSRLGSKAKSFSENSPAKVSMKQEAFAIAYTEDLSVYESLTAGSEAEARVLLEELLNSDPKLTDKIQVVPQYQIA